MSNINQVDLYRLNNAESKVLEIELAKEYIKDVLSAISGLAIDADKIDAVYNELSNIGIVANDIPKVITVANNIISVNTTSADINSVVECANNIAHIVSTGTNINAVVNVSDNITDVSTVGSNILDVKEVASVSASVSIVANSSTQVVDVGDDLAKGKGTNQPTDSAILNALDNATSARADAQSASTSESNSQLFQWESEAWKMTAQSFAEEPEDVYVKLYTSNGDGTFSYTNHTDYSATHYKNKAESYAASINPVEMVHISGAETITGDKTFSGNNSFSTSPTLPNGSAVGQADYATSTVGGTVKMRVSGDTVYLTNDGTDA